MSRRPEEKWIQHRGHRTYEICGSVAVFAAALGYDMNEYEDMTFPEWLVDVAAPWQKSTVVHKVARRFIHDLFYNESSGPFVVSDRIAREPPHSLIRTRHLSVDHALSIYDLGNLEFSVPQRESVVINHYHDDGRLRYREFKTHPAVFEACERYFLEDVMLGEPYDQLLDLMADEVFHSVFHDRKVLFAVNEFFAGRVFASEIVDEYPDAEKLFSSKGYLRRKAIPQWAKRAIFFRDRGRCTHCSADLSWAIDSLPREQFDHVIPLAAGGLNDVTNLQLLCSGCNLRKSDKMIVPPFRYRRWFEN